jgi:hypothetical protein
MIRKVLNPKRLRNRSSKVPEIGIVLLANVLIATNDLNNTEMSMANILNAWT